MEKHLQIKTTLKYYLTPVVQFLSCVCEPTDCSTLGFPVHHQLPEPAQTHVHWVSHAIQPSHPLPCPLPPVFSLSQNQGLFQWVNSSHEVAKILEFQLQHHSFQRYPRADLLQNGLIGSPCSPSVVSIAQSVSSVTHLCPTLCNPMDCSMPDFPVHHQLPELAQTHIHRVGDATQWSHPLPHPSPAPNPSQHQSLSQWVNSSHQVAKVLEFQL